MMKFLITAVAGLFLLTGAVTYARAEQPVCEGSIWSEQSLAFQQSQAIVAQLTPVQVEILLNKLGPPPNVEGDFEAYLVTQGPLAAIFVVQEGCTKARLGPSRAETIDNILGIVRAGDRV